VNDELNPEFNQRPPNNLHLPRDVTIRLELWDADVASEDPIGVWQGRGLPPTALPGANARILLEGRSWLTIRIRQARAFRGLGLRQYEQHPDYLEVLDVELASPAGRAELQAGDHITGIDGRLVADMTAGEASSQISLVGARPARLAIERNGIAEVIELDGGYTWPSL
jgi:membrane-associated protease RseP (regulator of RpoE activity)